MKLNYNERAWAIDLISEINIHCRLAGDKIWRASGERGLKANGQQTLFPDVLLHGSSGVLHGWELKMPDTDINDSEFIKNAKKKAEMLGSYSFLLWNARDAALWVKKEEGSEFKLAQSWSNVEISKRNDVEANRDSWMQQLEQILTDLEVYFSGAQVRQISAEQVLDDEFVLSMIEALYPDDSLEMQSAAKSDEKLRLGIQRWAIDNNIAIGEMFDELAKLNILAWISRFVFCHYLATKRPHAANVLLKIEDHSTIEEVKKAFESISAKLDFANVFESGLGDEIISKSGWQARLDFHMLLKDLKLSSYSDAVQRNVLERFGDVEKHKNLGQFATPPKLAAAMAAIGISDIAGSYIDPCCGSGTISRAIFDTKTSSGLSIEKSISTTWSSDKYQIPLHLTSLRLSDVDLLDSVIRVFKHDALSPELPVEVEFIDPKQQGKSVVEKLPHFDGIISNLPFVRQEKNKVKVPDRVLGALQQLGLHNPETAFGKADLYASICINLLDQLANGARMTLLVSNSWLSTQWGQVFIRAILEKARLVAVVQSGKSRWFENAKVVATLLVIEKNQSRSQNTKFLTTLVEIGKWDHDFVNNLKSEILGFETNGGVRSRTVSRLEIEEVENSGLSLRSLFYESQLALSRVSGTVSASSFFEFARGARTGWDKFFYPSDTELSKIETQYRLPFVKNSKAFSRLRHEANDSCFSCPEDKNTLEKMGHHGALGWIEKHENILHSPGVTFAQKMSEQHNPWYYLSPNEMADFCIPMNPYQTHGVYRLNSPTFVNQRLIRLKARDGSDLDLLHALMNSITTILSIELLGFGRGEGALDLNSRSLGKNLRILDPSSISVKGRENILRAFDPLLGRDLMDTDLEYQMSDRLQFEKVVLETLGLDGQLEFAISSLQLAVKDRIESSVLSS